MPPVRRILPMALAILAGSASHLPAEPLLHAPRIPSVPAAIDAAVPGEVIVQFHERSSAADRQLALGSAGGAILQRLSAPDGASAAPRLLRARVTVPVRTALEALRRDPSVAFAEPVFRIEAAAVANDTYYVSGAQWGACSADSPSVIGPSATTNAFGAGAEVAWARDIKGRGDVYVGILDEGVAHLHPELDTVSWRNPFEYADGRDNDGNGYADDLYGWDFAGRNASVYDGGQSGTTDRHGTQVAGVIGAEGGNGAGTSGMCWHVGVIPLKVLSNGTGTTADAVAALDYLIDLKSRHRLNVVAVNCSWSTPAYSQALHDAVLRAARAGILVVAASGNGGTNLDASPLYPAALDTRTGTSTSAAASYDAVLAVGALDRTGAMPPWSGWGPSRVDLLAPGVDVITTFPPGAYVNASGTSLAAAHVSGALALIASAQPGITASELRTSILSATTATSSAGGRVATGGRLDIGRALQAVALHDVAIAGLAVATPVSQNRTVSVTATLRNEGTVTETVTASLLDYPPSGGRPGTVSPAMTVTLAPGASSAQAFTWNTTGASEGTHVLTVQLRSVAGESDVRDNVRSASVLVSSVVTPFVGSVTPGTLRGGTSQAVTISGSGFATGARVSFAGGTGPVPAVSSVVVAADGRTLTVSVSAGATTTTGAPWDIYVTNPDGRLGRKVDCFWVVP